MARAGIVAADRRVVRLFVKRACCASICFIGDARNRRKGRDDAERRDRNSTCKRSAARGGLREEELVLLRQTVGVRPRAAPQQLAVLDSIRDEAARCLNCDCASAEHCSLHIYADAYDCDSNRFHGDKRRLAPCLEGRNAMLERGKCIACGICVQIARKFGEPIGLTFHGRGFEVAVAVPLAHSLD